MFVPLIYLAFVPPFPSGTSRDELSSFENIIRNRFGIIPVNFHFCQLSFNCLEPHLSKLQAHLTMSSVDAFLHVLIRTCVTQCRL